MEQNVIQSDNNIDNKTESRLLSETKTVIDTDQKIDVQSKQVEGLF